MQSGEVRTGRWAHTAAATGHLPGLCPSGTLRVWQGDPRGSSGLPGDLVLPRFPGCDVGMALLVLVPLPLSLLVETRLTLCTHPVKMCSLPGACAVLLDSDQGPIMGRERQGQGPGYGHLVTEASWACALRGMAAPPWVGMWVTDPAMEGGGSWQH